MQIKKLVLQQFRNFSKTELVISKPITVFVGNNGQGKTNLVESLVFLATARSFRTRDDLSLIQKSHEVAVIEALLDNGTNLKVAISSKGKYLQVGRNVIKRMTDFIGHCNVVLFSPDDISFFTASRKVRRQSIDIELSKISKEYMNLLSEYSKILTERNALLKGESIDKVYFQLVTQSLIDKMAPIIKQRISLIAYLEPQINKVYQYLTQSTSQIKINYVGPVNDLHDVNYQLKDKLDASYSRDLFMKSTQVGIHRDDYVFTIDDDLVGDVASQGQRRLLMVAFKIAIVLLVKEKTGNYPILCLDDLFSELDSVRRQRVLKLLPESVQVFITTTDLSFIDTKRDIQIVMVKNGEISIDREVQYVNN